MYTVDADVFSRTYRQTGAGAYIKSTSRHRSGRTGVGGCSAKTKEGVTHCDAGDYIVSNLLVAWDKQEKGGSPGGTAHMVSLARVLSNVDITVIAPEELMGATTAQGA